MKTLLCIAPLVLPLRALAAPNINTANHFSYGADLGWMDAPSGTNNPATVPATLPARFYRLVKP